LRSGTLATPSHAPGPSLLAALDPLHRLAGRDGVAHSLDIGADDALSPQFAEEGPEVVFDASPIGFEG